MLLLRDLAAGEPSAFEKLCDYFDQGTRDGAGMTLYSGLLQKALASIEHTFQRRAATSLLSGRHAVLPTAREAPTAAGDNLDLVKGMIWSPSHGDTAFTVRLFDEFMHHSSFRYLGRRAPQHLRTDAKTSVRTAAQSRFIWRSRWKTFSCGCTCLTGGRRTHGP
jgi:hypothetical protein